MNSYYAPKEVFSIDLPDDECESIRTVGDMYRLILDKLGLPYVASLEIEANSTGALRLVNKMQLTSWTTADVWLTLKSIIHEELGIKTSRIVESAAFVDDLGCD